jgi:hypothetical protein
MAELKTQKNDDSVDDFIAGIDDDRKREDSRTTARHDEGDHR